MRRAVLLGSVLFALAAFADPPPGEQLIHTRDGRELRGVIVSETQQGYVLRSPDGAEQLVLFSDIQDLVPSGAAPPPDVAPPPPPPPVPPLDPSELQPPPPQDPDAPPPGDPDVPAANDWRSARKGFHWSIGGGGMIDPGFTSSGGSAVVAFYVGAVPAVRWGFGWLDLSAEVMPLGYFKGAVKAFFLGLNPQLRINFARFYSLGVGLYGAVVLSPGVDFCVGPSFSPAIFRLGDLGQHEVRFWTATPMIATSASLTTNVLLMMLSYSYVF